MRLLAASRTRTGTGIELAGTLTLAATGELAFRRELAWLAEFAFGREHPRCGRRRHVALVETADLQLLAANPDFLQVAEDLFRHAFRQEIGRASCRERVCPYV